MTVTNQRSGATPVVHDDLARKVTMAALSLRPGMRMRNLRIMEQQMRSSPEDEREEDDEVLYDSDGAS